MPLSRERNAVCGADRFVVLKRLTVGSADVSTGGGGWAAVMCCLVAPDRLRARVIGGLRDRSLEGVVA